MEASGLDYLLVSTGITALMLLVPIILIMSSYKKVPQGKVLVRTGVGGTVVIFDGGFVMPMLHQMELMDITVQKLLLKFEGRNGLLMKDDKVLEAKVAYFFRVNPESVKEVAQSMGCDKASNKSELEQLFAGKFSEGTRIAGRKFTSEEIYDSLEELNRQIRMNIGTYLNGFVLEDLTIEYLEQVPLNA